jgi:hypothetical protein
VEWPSGERRVVSVTVTGVPNLDLNLAIGGETSDEGRLGEGEALHRRAIDGSLVVTIGETVPLGTLPVENVSDAYTLTVTEEPLKGGEVEPNGIEADANAIVAGEQLRGYLDHVGDVDLLRFGGTGGTYTVTLTTSDPSVIFRPATASSAPRHRPSRSRGEIIRIVRGPKSTPKREATWSFEIKR